MRLSVLLKFHSEKKFLWKETHSTIWLFYWQIYHCFGMQSL